MVEMTISNVVLLRYDHNSSLTISSDDEEDVLHGDNEENAPAHYQAWLPDGPLQALLLHIPSVPLHVEEVILNFSIKSAP